MNPLLALFLCVAAAGPDDRSTVIIVVGAPGTPEYGKQFQAWADQWDAAARKASAESIRIGSSEPGSTTDRDQLRTALAGKSTPGKEPLWLVLIGHGTFDGRDAKFNLRGP